MSSSTQCCKTNKLWKILRKSLFIPCFLTNVEDFFPQKVTEVLNFLWLRRLEATGEEKTELEKHIS